jgi:prepilin-type N-terminal cleavage/methylation domain-containing protein
LTIADRRLTILMRATNMSIHHNSAPIRRNTGEWGPQAASIVNRPCVQAPIQAPIRRNIGEWGRRNTGEWGPRRGFNVVELLIALAITGALLSATLVALNASFTAYQATTEVASTHTIGRLTIHRVLAMVRTGKDFGPFPTDPLESMVYSDILEFETAQGQIMSLEFDESSETLNVTLVDPDTGAATVHTLLQGVLRQTDADGDPLAPFTLQYAKGRSLYRATIDLMIRPDDSQALAIEGNNDNQTIRLVASAMPRLAAY